jgi:ATP-dependent Clp protease, protease subunit
MRVRINQLISDETGKPMEEVEKDTDRDFWMGAEDAVAYGLLSAVVASRDELEKRVAS